MGEPVLGIPVGPPGFDQSDLLYYANLQRQIAQSESTNVRVCCAVGVECKERSFSGSRTRPPRLLCGLTW